MRTALLVAGLLVTALLVVGGTASAERDPCRSGTPQNHCRPLCETGDIRDCLVVPIFPCVDLVVTTVCPSP